MNNAYLLDKQFIRLLFLPLTVSVMWVDAPGAGPLQVMMRKLEMSVAQIRNGIAQADLGEIMEGANWIAKRAEPGFIEKARTLAEIGSEAPRFKKADEAMRKAAQAIALAATHNDLNAVEVNTRLLLAQCHGCHQRQRPPINLPGDIDGAPIKTLEKENMKNE